MPKPKGKGNKVRLSIILHIHFSSQHSDAVFMKSHFTIHRMGMKKIQQHHGCPPSLVCFPQSAPLFDISRRFQIQSAFHFVFVAICFTQTLSECKYFTVHSVVSAFPSKHVFRRCFGSASKQLTRLSGFQTSKVKMMNIRTMQRMETDDHMWTRSGERKKMRKSTYDGIQAEND